MDYWLDVICYCCHFVCGAVDFNGNSTEPYDMNLKSIVRKKLQQISWVHEYSLYAERILSTEYYYYNDRRIFMNILMIEERLYMYIFSDIVLSSVSRGK